VAAAKTRTARTRGENKRKKKQYKRLAWHGRSLPLFIFQLEPFLSFSFFVFCASCNDAGKFAGNNFNCVNCAVSCAISLAHSLSLSPSIYHYPSLSPAGWLLQSLAFSGIPGQSEQQRPSCGKIKLLIRSVGQGSILYLPLVLTFSLAVSTATDLLLIGNEACPDCLMRTGTRFPPLSR